MITAEHFLLQKFPRRQVKCGFRTVKPISVDTLQERRRDARCQEHRPTFSKVKLQNAETFLMDNGPNQSLSEIPEEKT